MSSLTLEQEENYRKVLCELKKMKFNSYLNKCKCGSDNINGPYFSQDFENPSWTIYCEICNRTVLTEGIEIEKVINLWNNIKGEN